jgi:hypothetical protein
MYDARRYPEGVPNPFVPMVETFPSYVHGADYTRPAFAMPYMVAPFNVLGPAPFDDLPLEGLGAISEDQALTVASAMGAVAVGAGTAALILGAVSAAGWKKGDGVIGDRFSAFVVGGIAGGLLGFVASIAAVATLSAAQAAHQEGVV